MKTDSPRILLKLSGEILSGDHPFGIDEKALLKLAQEIKWIHSHGFQLGLVIGGGNMFRGIRLENAGIERTPADQMGMLATMINGLAVQQALRSLGVDVKVLSALDCPKVAESYTWEKANQYLDEGKIILFVAGTGNPYFTTDTAAALRACEIKANYLLKATKVDGVYSADPKKDPKAKKYEELSYTQYITEKLGVMDITAVTLCMNSNIPIFVFSMDMIGQIPVENLISEHKKYGTLIH